MFATQVSRTTTATTTATTITTTTTTTTKRLGPCVFFLLLTTFPRPQRVGLLMAERDVGPARRREGAPAPLVAATRADDRAHGVGRSHSACKGAGPETNDVLRSQKTVNSREDAVFFELYDEDTAGWRPPCLGEPPVPQARVERHTAEQMIESFVPVPILDLEAPVPQMVEQLVGVLKIFDNSLAEQAIEAHSPRHCPAPCCFSFCRSWRNSWWKCRSPPLVTVSSRRHCRRWSWHGTRTQLARRWCHCSGARGLHSWLWSTQHTQWRPPEGVTASQGRYTNTGQG